MERLNYPLLYYQLNATAVLGILVGTDIQMVDKDVKNLKSTLSTFLQKQYKKNDEYPFVDILVPRLKIIEVNIRPTYKEKHGSFPLTTKLKIPVPLVYGETEDGNFECYLPLFDESFYFYEARQFESLARHFTINILNNKSPEELYRLLAYAPPMLETVTLKIHSNRDYEWSGWNQQREFDTLERLAERYPQSKAVQRNKSAFPEAAWELEDKVLEVVEKMVAQRANVLVVGEHGVGKSAVLRQAIRKIATSAKKQKLDYTFWRIMSQRITASAKYLGEWEESVEWLIEDLNAANGVLWVVDIVQLLQAGGEGAEDSVAAFLLPFIQEGKLQIVGEATPQELESMRRLLPGFAESFQVVKIEELSEQKVQAILNKFSDFSRQNLKITIHQEALDLAYRLLLRYFPYESFPGKGVKFLGQCVSEAKLNRASEIDRQAIISNFVRQTGLPELFLRDDILLDQEELGEHFYSKIIGQPKAVNQLCSIVKIYKAGLNNPHKPISTLLFAGPTGVGKTASAKALADYFFGKGQQRSPLIRIDMSEFQYPGQINRLIGSGKEVGQLVKDIRERPFSVLLLDEVEKANPSIFDALLGVLDEGVLVDAFGRVTNFRNTIIIMTSNLGASNRNAIGFKHNSDDDATYLAAIEKFFRPEFINRIDGIVMFNTLNANDIRQITLKELEELKQREGFVKRGLKVHFSEKVVAYLSKIGFDEKYGARPLQRALEDRIVQPLAGWLLEHEKVKQTNLRIDFNGTQLTIEV